MDDSLRGLHEPKRVTAEMFVCPDQTVSTLFEKRT